MQQRIFRSIFLTALAALVIVGIFSAVSFYGVFERRIMGELRMEADTIAAALPRVDDAGSYLSSVENGQRVTLIGADGTVVFDDSADHASMENHLTRPEVVQALADGHGESHRYSGTLTEKTFYCAVRLDDGQVLRTSVTESSILGLINRILFPLVCVSFLTAALSLALSRRLARSITDPIGRIDFASPLASDAYDELSPLLLRLEKQNETLLDQLDQLGRQRRELDAITENMSEGLLMLNMEAEILSINKSALRIFGAKKEKCLGSNVLSVNRSPELRDVVTAAQRGEEGERVLSLGGHVYQLLSTPVRADDGQFPGIVVLLLDITARHEAESNRREFTANVSHELRTPLTSIAGYSEIMASGLAKPEDMRGFAGKINVESKRLIALVNDILELSRLDEKSPTSEEKTSIDLLSLCNSVASRLQPIADKKGVTISISGDRAVVQGVMRLLDEAIYNLVDNAVKYNRQGGAVRVTVAELPDRTTVSVADDGIGIPREHMDRIFERFYRVDKSHSKDTGGTGLGLAIAKHAAEANGARISVTSAVGEGSCFTLTFVK